MRTCTECQRDYADDMDFCPRDGKALPRLRAATEFELNLGLSQRYRVVRKLGEGGMGSVFLAEQTGLTRMVAIKVLRRRLLDDPEFLSRFQDEALSLGRINHQNVVTVYECAQTDDGLPYIAMQFLEGETLAAALPLPEILQQAARGLNAAHKLEIVHRDLKPDNIFLAYDDEGRLLVKIVDFGISKMRESPSHTNTGAFIGTGAYMSPEQASGMKSEALDKRSDVIRWGLWRMRW
jgi:eukaryotic-like serine/threonine-protein kinase